MSKSTFNRILGRQRWTRTRGPMSLSCRTRRKLSFGSTCPSTSSLLTRFTRTRRPTISSTPSRVPDKDFYLRRIPKDSAFFETQSTTIKSVSGNCFNNSKNRTSQVVSSHQDRPRQLKMKTRILWRESRATRKIPGVKITYTSPKTWICRRSPKIIDRLLVLRSINRSNWSSRRSKKLNKRPIIIRLMTKWLKAPSNIFSSCRRATSKTSKRRRLWSIKYKKSLRKRNRTWSKWSPSVRTRWTVHWVNKNPAKLSKSILNFCKRIRKKYLLSNATLINNSFSSNKNN